jgi:DNA-binding NtrC family response regulator
MHQGNILVVDDEKLIRWSLQELLTQEGYKVTAVEDGASALAAIEEQPFDAMLLDHRLPDIDGIEVLSRLRARDLEIPVLMITSYSTVENAVTAMKAGASDYITKPFRTDDISHRLGRILETTRLRREVQSLRQEQRRRFGFDRVVGKSAPLQAILRSSSWSIASCPRAMRRSSSRERAARARTCSPRPSTTADRARVAPLSTSPAPHSLNPCSSPSSSVTRRGRSLMPRR